MEMKHSTDIRLLLCPDILLVISAAQESKNHTVRPQGRLDDIRNITGIFLVVKIGQILSGGILMLGQIVIGTVCDTPQLAQPKGNRNSISLVALL